MNDDIDMRSAFSGWIEDIDVLADDNAPDSENDDEACAVVQKSRQGKHGGARPGAGRRQKEHLQRRPAGEDLTAVPLLERKQQRAANARAARLERLEQSKQATQPAGGRGGSCQMQAVVLLGAGSHADCRENTMMSITDLQKTIVFAAEQSGHWH
jgi:hypothetical protein